MKVKARVKRYLNLVGIPLQLKDVKRVYLFGSSLVKETYNDIDVAVFLSPYHRMFENGLVIYSENFGRVEFHYLPDTKWHRKRLRNSSKIKRLSKRIFK